ncbi:hypothetical protein [Peribacillus loiseleuriae]|uniref:hypothetical protein n=1 Tax=Peribacillus loiseleuriae TaxID=1679170 RepID=UPI000A5EAB0C|nr:hypothetical protein [Peribacillus loiseleuriae]
MASIFIYVTGGCERCPNHTSKLDTKQDKEGNVPHSWQRMTEVKVGDQIFHFDRIAYTKAKEPFIQNVIKKVKEERVK